MKLGTIVKWSFILSLLISFLAAYLKMIHFEGVRKYLILGIAMTFVFIITAIIEVTSSKRIGNSEKIMWTIAFIFMSTLTGILYFSMGRKRIV